MPFDIKTCGLYKSMTDGEEEPGAYITFMEETMKIGISISCIENFYNISSNAKPYKGFKHWTEEHFTYILHNPKILHDLAFLNVENLESLVIGYGFWCTLKCHKLEYFDPSGQPLLGGEIQDMIEKRKCVDVRYDVENLIKGGFTITVLQRLFSSEIDIDQITIHQLSARRYQHSLTVIYGSRPMDCAAYYGQMEMIRYFRDFGLRWTEKTVISAVSNNQVSVAKYLLDQGCPRCDIMATRLMMPDICNLKLDTLMYIFSIDKEPYLDRVIEDFVIGNNLEICRYLLRRGLSPTGVDVAARPFLYKRAGNLFEMIILLREFDVPWISDPRVSCFLKTLIESHPNEITTEQLKYICDLGCPIDKESFLHIVNFCDFDFIKYIYERCRTPPSFYKILSRVLSRIDDRAKIMYLMKGNIVNIDEHLPGLLYHCTKPAHIVEILEDFHDAGLDWSTKMLRRILFDSIERSDKKCSALTKEIKENRFIGHCLRECLDLEQRIKRETERNFSAILDFSIDRTHGPRTMRTEKPVVRPCTSEPCGRSPRN